MRHSAHMNESWHTYKLSSRMNESCHSIWISLGAHMIGACNTYEHVMTRIWMSHCAHSNWVRAQKNMPKPRPRKSTRALLCHTYERAMAHIKRVHARENMQKPQPQGLSGHCHVTHVNESRHAFERVMMHIWMSHVTHMNANLSLKISQCTVFFSTLPL